MTLAEYLSSISVIKRVLKVNCLFVPVQVPFVVMDCFRDLLQQKNGGRECRAEAGKKESEGEEKEIFSSRLFVHRTTTLWTRWRKVIRITIRGSRVLHVGYQQRPRGTGPYVHFVALSTTRQPRLTLS